MEYLDNCYREGKVLMNNIEIIYKKHKGKKTENNIQAYIRKEGVWALFGKKDREYECLQVGKSKDVGYEIIYDISCMQNLGFKEGTKKYVNEFGDYFELKYEEGIVQEYLYPHIKEQGYKVLLFLYVCDENDEKKEKLLAWLTRAKYWRDLHRPFNEEQTNFYEKNKCSKIGTRKECLSWKSERGIKSFLKMIEWEVI